MTTETLTLTPTEEDLARVREALRTPGPPVAHRVLAALGPIIERERRAAKAEAWDEGFTAAWYKALPYEDSRDASEAGVPNPYERDA